MAQSDSGRVALFSIHPTYAEAILDGRKQVEFRRTRLPADVTHMVIYATAPVQRVVGIVEVEETESSSPRRVWAAFGTVGAIARKAFDSYYAGAATAHAIKVRNPRRLIEPVRLAHLDPNLRPPQSFQYLSRELLSATMGELTSSTVSRPSDRTNNSAV
ncbi:ASCH domain-containing protein [Microlunatus panaciterrae]|uniref:Transcriptional regulator n=2 Tax=Microlunatus panaciterrae TaxID=400768 RepID=A0ABS2RPU9_9ACTN|nr:ASCH domain-containing protein [Microlunatus panaciterrae]MBM7800512.1 putative transcriptional regulator [Microlunatus panaciterrae]